MGTDIHITLEVRDGAGTWHAVYDSGLLYTAWWQSRFHQGKERYDDDAHGLSTLDQRNYRLFGFFSCLRGGNPLVDFDVGKINGWARRSGTTGWPDDISHLARANLDNGDNHNHGWMTLGDVRRMVAQLDDIPTTDEERLGETVKAAQYFARNLEGVLAALLGTKDTPPLVGHPFQTVPDDDGYNDPDFDVCQGGSSGHATLRGIQILRDTRFHDHDPEHIRVLVCYDN